MIQKIVRSMVGTRALAEVVAVRIVEAIVVVTIAIVEVVRAEVATLKVTTATKVQEETGK